MGAYKRDVVVLIKMRNLVGIKFDEMAQSVDFLILAISYLGGTII